MRALVQRVYWAEVEVDSAVVGQVRNGLLVYAAVTPADTPADAQAMAAKRLAANSAFLFNGNLDNTGTGSVQFSINTGTPNYVYSDLLGREVLKLDGTQYLRSDLRTSDLGIDGNNARTISIFAKVDEFAERMGLFDMGSYGNYQNFALRTVGTADGTGSLPYTDKWRVQRWASDVDVVIPDSKDTEIEKDSEEKPSRPSWLNRLIDFLKTLFKRKKP